MSQFYSIQCIKVLNDIRNTLDSLENVVTHHPHNEVGNKMLYKGLIETLYDLPDHPSIHVPNEPSKE